MVLFCFTRDHRILRRSDFVRIQSGGRRFYTHRVVFVYLPRTDEPSRMGCSVSKRTARRAHDRNHVKRLVREVFRLHRQELPFPVEVVIIARSPAPDASFQDLTADFNRFCRHLRAERPAVSDDAAPC